MVFALVGFDHNDWGGLCFVYFFMLLCFFSLGIDGLVLLLQELGSVCMMFNEGFYGVWDESWEREREREGEFSKRVIMP